MFFQLFINAIAFYVIAYLVPGFTINSWPTLLVMAIVWGLLNLLVKPVLMLLTLPINILTLGLFTFIVNAVLLMIMSAIVPGFHVDGFGTALIAAIVLSLINMLLSKKSHS